jgi:hypothetical protein
VECRLSGNVNQAIAVSIAARSATGMMDYFRIADKPGVK